jgi:hypothetical protein
VPVAIVKKATEIGKSVYTILQILSVTLLKKSPIIEVKGNGLSFCMNKVTRNEKNEKGRNVKSKGALQPQMELEESMNNDLLRLP